jgi:hypothetical protein
MLGARREGVRQDLPSRHFFVRRRHGVAPPPGPLATPSWPRAVPTLPRRPRRNPPPRRDRDPGRRLQRRLRAADRVPPRDDCHFTSRSPRPSRCRARARAAVLPASCRGATVTSRERGADRRRRGIAGQSSQRRSASTPPACRGMTGPSRLTPPTPRVVDPLKPAALADPEPAPARSSRSPSVRGLRPRSTKQKTR